MRCPRTLFRIKWQDRVPDTEVLQQAKMKSIIDGSEIPRAEFNMTRVLPPPSVPFYRYRGSLTTPPCTRNVIWSVFATPQVISRSQLNEFRQISLNKKLSPGNGGNIRPLQPINRRQIITNNVFYV
ncbi:putative carbonic anhydrase 5 [Aplysia californica]|uniref:carbonic anhydrase n=1 Tax=Aplysia californica TaxID=6500 RepID=A0ABM1ADV4_APLCA|nr:putative carbonic anhydrase 5 [Aplysia californica]